jgi:hypothetical protein
MNTRLLVCAVIICLRGTILLSAHPAAEPAEKLKTAFIFQFAKYIEWPDEQNATSFSISMVGSSPMWNFLQDLAREKRIKEKAIELYNVTGVSELRRSHVVVLTDDNEETVTQVLRRTRGTHALLVGQGDGLASMGIMINFFITPEGRLRFEINRKAAEAEGLVISSQLLKMARIVE